MGYQERMMRQYRRKTRWPEGTWMKLRSGKLLAGQMDASGNMTQYELADLARCSRGFISHLVSGRKTTCNPDLAERIARSLGVHIEMLFEPSNQPVGLTSQPRKRVPA